MNFKKAKENTGAFVSKNSTLITCILTAFGVGMTAWMASREIPKAEKEVKDILKKKDLTKKQKAVEVTKTVAKNCWKTTAIAIGTVLLVTGTNAVTVATNASTVAGLTNTIATLDQKVKDYRESIEENPNKKVKEEIKNAVNQKAVNRATADVPEEYFTPDVNCPDRYVWVDTWTGAKFKATYKAVETAAQLTELRIPSAAMGYQTVFDFYEELVNQGAEFLGEAYPQLADDSYWYSSMCCDLNVYHDSKGYTIHTIGYNEPTMNGVSC